MRARHSSEAHDTPLSCSAQVKTDATVGSAGIPTVGNMPMRIARRLLGLKQPTVELAVVNGMSGVLRPGRLTLLLGPPGCGKSTFLKVSGWEAAAADSPTTESAAERQRRPLQRVLISGITHCASRRCWLARPRGCRACASAAACCTTATRPTSSR
jgi:ABC-type glutathione transport system ATPase component